MLSIWLCSFWGTCINLLAEKGSMKSPHLKKILWPEFLTDFQNVGIKIFRKARGLIKKILKNFRRGLWGPKMTKNLKMEFYFYQIFIFFTIFGSFSYLLKFFVFFVDSRVYSKHFGILFLKFEQKFNFSQLFFQKKKHRKRFILPYGQKWLKF